MEKTVHNKNFEQWNGTSDSYHIGRPIPPEIVTKIIFSWLQKEPDTVVDVGCGTGLSTIIWKDIAKNIIGIEPNADLRETAERSISSNLINFRNGVSNETGLPPDYADVVTVSQAFHWMDIDSTLMEFHRILRANGVLAIYDFVLPPIIDWEIEKAYLKLRAKCSDIVYSQENPPIHNDKNTYNDRITAFGKFRHSREVVFHTVEKGTPQKVMDFIYNMSNAIFAIKINPDIKKDVDELTRFVKEKCSQEFEIIYPYKMVIAIK